MFGPRVSLTTPQTFPPGTGVAWVGSADTFGKRLRREDAIGDEVGNRAGLRRGAECQHFRAGALEAVANDEEAASAAGHVNGQLASLLQRGGCFRKLGKSLERDLCEAIEGQPIESRAIDPTQTLEVGDSARR